MIKVDKLKERIKKNFKENKVLFFVFITIWIVTIVATLLFFDSTLGKQSIGNESYNRSVVEIDNNTKIIQKVGIEDKAESVSVLFATYARNNKGNVNVSIIGNDSGFVYADKNYGVSTIQDNSYITIKLSEPLNNKKDKTISINISSDCKNGEAVGDYYTNDKAFEDSAFLINEDKVSNADLCVKFLVNNSDLKTFSNSLLFFTIVGLTLISMLVLLINPKEEILFASLLVVLGLTMMIIIVPASPPDELIHYEAALQVSNKMMFKENPKLIDSAFLKYGYMYGHFNISPGYIRFINEFGKPIKPIVKITIINVKSIMLPSF